MSAALDDVPVGRCRRLKELAVPDSQKLDRGSLLCLSRKRNTLAVEGLYRMPERRSVLFLQEVGPDLDHVVGADTHEESVEGGVMEPA